MRCEIVDIGDKDAFNNDKKILVGEKGTFATIRSVGGYCSGELYFDNSPLCLSNPVAFHRVKIKPVFDDTGLSQ